MQTTSGPNPIDVAQEMPDSSVPLCPDCVEAYRNGISPGETACEDRAKGIPILPCFTAACSYARDHASEAA